MLTVVNIDGTIRYIDPPEGWRIRSDADRDLGVLARMIPPEERKKLQEAVAKVKAFLDDAGVEVPPNDLIITGIEDEGDLWVFHWNNGWAFLESRYHTYPGLDPLAVFKEDGRLLQIPRSYSWVEGSVDSAVEEVRRQWRESRNSS